MGLERRVLTRTIMSSPLNSRRPFYPHEYFAWFAGLLLCFCIARLISFSAESLTPDLPSWAIPIVGLECLLILALALLATARRAGQAKAVYAAALLVAAHFAVFGLIQIARTPGPEQWEAVTTLGKVAFYFPSAVFGYVLACVLIADRWKGWLLLSAVAAVLMAGSLLWLKLAETLMLRVGVALGGAAGVAAIGAIAFLISRAPAIRGLFSNRPQHHLVQELANAKRVHESLFPEPLDTEALRFGYAYRPMTQIGGDFIHTYPKANGSADGQGRQPFYMTLIDVTGHGISSALTVNRLNAELKQYFATDPDACPSKVLAHLNEYALLTMAEHGLFATGVCIRVDPARRTATVASAGHPACKAYSGSGLQDVASDGPMLGVFPAELFDAAPVSVEIEEGGRLVVTTDGAIESCNREGEMIGQKRLHGIIERACRMSVPAKRETAGSELLGRRISGRLSDRADVRQPVGLIQQVLRQKLNDHPCALADEIMLSIDDFLQQDCQDDILIATIEMN